MLDMVMIEGNSSNIMRLIKEVKNGAPVWFLHGVTFFDSDSDDTIKLCIWGENKFWEDDSFSYATKSEEITEEEKEEVLKDAALQAISMCMSKEFIKDYGKILLNKHPECRDANDEYSAIIKAALQERMDTFTDEMYEIY